MTAMGPCLSDRTGGAAESITKLLSPELVRTQPCHEWFVQLVAGSSPSSFLARVLSQYQNRYAISIVMSLRGKRRPNRSIPCRNRFAPRRDQVSGRERRGARTLETNWIR